MGFGVGVFVGFGVGEAVGFDLGVFVCFGVAVGLGVGVCVFVGFGHEVNPMMGHRGCRLAVTYPEIAEMQTKAVIGAAINTQKKHPDWNVVPEIMIPLVGDVKELKFVKDIVVKTADECIANSDVKLQYHIGTMIEIPRAAILAGEIATEAEFFSFGTNDLTQMTFGFSRDDAGKFLGSYYDAKIYEQDPFQKLDQRGVGTLVKLAVDQG